ncbi:MAG: hypothetical protein EXQ70_01100 [Solirubrobacterales bacterium]|nr:hypothetical protein [Solirubrobacterales bacterium]
MAVLTTYEFEGTVEEYDKVGEVLGAEVPEGLIAHTGVDLGGKMKVVDIWESPEHFAKFGQERLGPAVAEVMGTDGPAPGAPEIQELHDLKVHELHK